MSLTDEKLARLRGIAQTCRHLNARDMFVDFTDVLALLDELESLRARVAELGTQLSDVRDNLDSVCEWCQDRCRCSRGEST